ncbi:MAG: hypothetical protein HN348_34370, partial [Proteobacteria bacterium]|nr:hypothetical protein [Pseudomonadota bacterium]
IVFIAVGLQEPKKGGGGGVRSMAFGISTMVTLQTLVGLLAVLVLSMVVQSQFHPGFGLLLPLGYEQGPGQALSMGSAWENVDANGMPDGSQVGLIIAAMGFGWSVVIGVPLVAWGKARGLVSRAAAAPANKVDEAEQKHELPPGSLEFLSRQVVVIAVCYLATYGVCYGISLLLAGAPKFAAMVWGFHFIFGALIAMGVRTLLKKTSSPTPLDSRLLGRMGGLTVDFITTAALAAVQLSVFGANWLPIVLVTSLGGMVTLVGCLWLARRAFDEASFEHCVVWFGMSTGTLPMGLALLRVIDPEMRSPAPISAVLGSAGSILGAAPVVIFIHPIPIGAWPDSYPSGGWLAVGIAALYLAGVLVAWWKFGGLRLTLPWARLWPPEEA